MTHDRYSILFDEVKIGPKIAKNRFYQVPHCTGSGHKSPRTLASIRGMKAEGGWGVVCTEECEIHPSSDLSSFAEGRIWDDSYIPMHRLMTDAVHQHDALAGIQLVHNGLHCANRYSRTAPLSPSGGAVEWEDPVQSRAMTKRDIAQLRKWFREAAIRSRNAGYDIVYVYASHNMTLLTDFLQSRYNHRTDEYGGSLENRVRLLREVLEDTKEAVGNDCAVALRLGVDESGDDALKFNLEGQEIVKMLADIPDLWDVNISGWENDSITSRFGESGHQEQYISFVKTLTDKPVVGVGRFTSPDTMVSQIKRGIIDFIGAARPSIADPFLPEKIRTDRVEEIRECIGCNMCTTGDYYAVPLRCTQNPTMGEEFRKGWHPEIIQSAASNDKILIVGAGPSGLECGLALSKRGYDVVISDKRSELGGRVLQESRLPNLGEWKRVIDHRLYMLDQKPNVDTYINSELSVNDILEFGFERVVLATGASWRQDGVGRSNQKAFTIDHSATVLSVDELLSGSKAAGHIVVYDDDYYYMANVLAEKIIEDGGQVTFVTSANEVSVYSHATLEQARIQARLIELGIEIITGHMLTHVAAGHVVLTCNFTDKQRSIGCDATLPVTSRTPNTTLLEALTSTSALLDHSIKSVTAIGDCYAPGSIAASVYSGHQYARQLDNSDTDEYGFTQEDH